MSEPVASLLFTCSFRGLSCFYVRVRSAEVEAELAALDAEEAASREAAEVEADKQQDDSGGAAGGDLLDTLMDVMPQGVKELLGIDEGSEEEVVVVVEEEEEEEEGKQEGWRQEDDANEEEASAVATQEPGSQAPDLVSLEDDAKEGGFGDVYAKASLETASEGVVQASKRAAQAVQKAADAAVAAQAAQAEMMTCLTTRGTSADSVPPSTMPPVAIAVTDRDTDGCKLHSTQPGSPLDAGFVASPYPPSGGAWEALEPVLPDGIATGRGANTQCTRSTTILPLMLGAAGRSNDPDAPKATPRKEGPESSRRRSMQSMKPAHVPSSESEMCATPRVALDYKGPSESSTSGGFSSRDPDAPLSTPRKDAPITSRRMMRAMESTDEGAHVDSNARSVPSQEEHQMAQQQQCSAPGVEALHIPLAVPRRPLTLSTADTIPRPSLRMTRMKPAGGAAAAATIDTKRSGSRRDPEAPVSTPRKEGPLSSRRTLRDGSRDEIENGTRSAVHENQKGCGVSNQTTDTFSL